MDDFWSVPRQLPLRCACMNLTILHGVTAVGESLRCTCALCGRASTLTPTAKELAHFKLLASSVPPKPE